MTVDDAHAEQLASKAASAAHLTTSSSSSIQSIYSNALARQTQLEQDQDDKYLSLAPTFLSLHQQASSSKELLTSLETFLSTFQSDLSTLSTHLSALQNTSHQIDSRLDATKDVEIRLASFLSEIALSPRIVDLFFDSDPESRPDLWQKAVRQLERALEATSSSASLNLPTSEAVVDVQAVKEVRAVAEACKNVVASKLRTYLMSPHATIRSSVTTNLQVIQTSVLLRHHRPFYAFLSRHMPRAAIDVQRSYVAAARLYFETAFRRYTRSLGVVRKRWTEPTSTGLVPDPCPPDSGSYAATAVASLQSSMSSLNRSVTGSSEAGVSSYDSPRTGGGNTPASRAASQDSDTDTTDPWLFPATRLQYARLESDSSTVLGYQADDLAFKACPENLFRSLSLVLIDNACSEYTFLARFFEGIGAEDDAAQAVAKSSASTPMHELGPDESASTAGDDTVEEIDFEATPVQLSSAERNSLKGRGASEEIFRQIMEPTVSTWTTFARSLSQPTIKGVAASVSSSSAGSLSISGYFSLLSMLQLNDAALGLLESRGCGNSLVEGALMGFKIHSYPLLKKFLDDQISSITSLHPSTTTTGTGSIWNVLNFSTNPNTPHLTPPLAHVIAVRYTSLITKTLYLVQDSPSHPILSSLHQLRSQLARLFTSKTSSWSHRDAVNTVKSLITTFETVLQSSGLTTHPKVQNEFSFWHQVLVSIPNA